MGDRIRRFHWSESPLGPTEAWPDSLRTSVGVMLSASTPLAIYWGDDLIFLYNDGLRTLIGDKHPHALGRPAREVFPEAWETIGPALKRALVDREAASVHDHHVRILREGEIQDAWVDYSFTPVPQQDGSAGGVLVFAKETTEQIQAEGQAEARAAELSKAYEELRVSTEEIRQRNEELRAARHELEAERRRYQELLELAPYGYVVTDVRGVVQEANRVASELLGIPRGFLVGKPLSVYVAAEDRDTFRQLTRWDERAGTRPRRVETELWLQSREREQFPVVLSAVAVGDDRGTASIHWMVRDISERKKTEERLRKAEGDYRELVEHAPAGIYEIDFRNNRFTSVNEAVCQMTGYSRDELLSMDPFDLLDEEGRALFRRRIAKWLGGEEPDRNVEFTVKTKDGETIDAVLDVTFTADGDGRPVGAAVVAHDVTERKQKERQISRYNQVVRGINRIFQQVIRTETEEALAEMCLTVALDVTESQFGFVGEVGPDGLLHDIAISDMGWEECQMAEQRGHRRPPGGFVPHGLHGRVIHDGRSLLTNDPTSHPDSLGAPKGHPLLQNFLGVPLSHHDETIGMLAVANRDGGYSQEQQEDLEALAPAVVEALLRKRAEDELRRERQLLETIFDTIPVMLTVYEPDIEDVALNKHVGRVTGWTEEDTAETTIMELAYPDPAYRQEAADYMRSLEPGFRDIRMATKDGRTAETSWANVQLPDGRRVGIGIDITEQKRAEEALARSQRRLAWILDKTGVGTWLNELPLGDLNWDEETKRLFFVDPDVQPTIDLFWSRVHPEDREPTRLAVEEAIRESTLYAIEHRVIDPETGEERWVRSIGQASYAEDGTPTHFDGINIDTTERKRSEKALRRYADQLVFLHELDKAILSARSAEEVAAAVVERIPHMLPCLRASVALHDQEAKELMLLAVDREHETGLGRGWRGPSDMPWNVVVDQLREGRDYVVEDLQALPASSPLTAQLQAEGVRAQVYEPIMIGGEMAGTLNVSMDRPGRPSAAQMDLIRQLTTQLAVGLEQARLQEEVERYACELEELVSERTAALEASEARFRTIFEEAAIGIALIDAEGSLMATNPALQRMLGSTEAELTGTHVFDHLVDVGQEADTVFQELLAGELSEQPHELRYLCDGGRTGQANVTVSLLHRDSNAAPLVLALVEDITERKQAQQALIQAERLTIIGRMAASLAHEVNNPLQAVVGCLGLAVEALDEGEDAAELMDVALDELKRAARIVHRMRDVTRREKGKTELADVGTLLEKVLMLTHKQAENYDVEVIWETTDELLLVPMVPDRVQQVFLNLVLNAIDAMPHGGELRIRAEQTKEPPGVQISFADTGPGISPESVEGLFEAFHSDKEQGLGLGLYVSRNIVHEHGGRIEVESELGRGATFIVWLPREEPGGRVEARA